MIFIKLDEILKNRTSLNENKKIGILKEPKKSERIKVKRDENGLTTKLKQTHLKQRKIDRPSLDVLLKEVKELGYVETGKKYNVSDNAIRKCIKYYQKYVD